MEGHLLPQVHRSLVVDIAVCWCAVIDGQPPTKLHVGQREETRGKRRGVVLALSVSSE